MYRARRFSTPIVCGGVVRKDLKAGARFTRLTVIRAIRRYRGSRWENSYRHLCRCKCGRVVKINKNNLITKNRNRTRSCGCLGRELARKQMFRHGHATGKRTPEYRAYCDAKGRCSNSNHPAYKHYGARGIKFLFASFQEFFAELGRRPEGLSLDRIHNTTGNYEPGNVRWTDKKTQIANRRCSTMAVAA